MKLASDECEPSDRRMDMGILKTGEQTSTVKIEGFPSWRGAVPKFGDS